MTLEDFNNRLMEIVSNAKDPERAHSQEDDLRDEILKFIAGGQCPDPAAWAKMALRTSEIEFPRWCA